MIIVTRSLIHGIAVVKRKDQCADLIISLYLERLVLSVTKPLVSIMMPAYNAGRYLYDAIMSVKNQSYGNWQLCVVDDGSEDSTYQLAMQMSYEDPRIYVTQIPHQGCPVARNEAINMSDGDIIARLDADDIHDSKRIEKQVAFLLDNLDYDLVTCRYNWLKGRITIPQKSEGMVEELYLKNQGGRPVNATIVAWSYVYGKVGGFNPDLEAGSDGDWNFRAIQKKMRWGYIPEYLYTQRRHDEQISNRLRYEQRRTHLRCLEKYHAKDH